MLCIPGERCVKQNKTLATFGFFLMILIEILLMFLADYC